MPFREGRGWSRGQAPGTGRSCFPAFIPLHEISELVKPFVPAQAFENNFAVASMELRGKRIRRPFHGTGADDDRALALNITNRIERVRKSSKT